MLQLNRFTNLFVPILALLVSATTVYLDNNHHEDQIAEQLRNQQIQNLVELGQYLHTPQFSDARTAVRLGHIKPTTKDSMVRRVCSSFGFAGSMVRTGAVDKKAFLDYWGIPLAICSKRLPKSIWEEDASAGLGFKAKDYYEDFVWLMNEANKNLSTKKHDIANQELASGGKRQH
ncbi:MAG TPA: hypothetical protein VF598_13990 [Hymenobacter sp.]|jgi:hypothetical protein